MFLTHCPQCGCGDVQDIAAEEFLCLECGLVFHSKTRQEDAPA